MRVVHLSHTDAGAGAGRAAHRIHHALRARGLDSHMLVARKRTDDVTVELVNGASRVPLGTRIREYLEAKFARRISAPGSAWISPACFGSFVPDRDPRVSSADVVVLYWINGAFIAPESLAGLTQPIVWRLSDVWPFTGGCHYPGSCVRFEHSCGDCPQLARPSARDLSWRLWQRKAKAWDDLDITVAAPSEWIAGLVRRSSLFANRRVEVVPTGVDLERFRPIDTAQARARFCIPTDKRVILFGALDPAADARKGFKPLLGALERLAQGPLASSTLAVVFGDVTETGQRLPLPARFLGRIDDDEVLAAAYSAADLVVVPSLEDNLPNVALEAIACGTPVAGFDVCGMQDIVRTGWNGALASGTEPDLLATLLEGLLADPAQLSAMGGNARSHAEARFSLARQARRYAALFQELHERYQMRTEKSR